jgi:hypothetical protein
VITVNDRLWWEAKVNELVSWGGKGRRREEGGRDFKGVLAGG